MGWYTGDWFIGILVNGLLVTGVVVNGLLVIGWKRRFGILLTIFDLDCYPENNSR